MSTYKKMMVTAFTKIAKRWEDSKDTPHSLRRYGFKNARQWGRTVAACYNLDDLLSVPPELLNQIEDVKSKGGKVTQSVFDEFAEEEVNCW